ncbi:MAG: DUF4349 domain-containing protein [Microbacteriaceae bacterium]
MRRPLTATNSALITLAVISGLALSGCSASPMSSSEEGSVGDNTEYVQSDRADAGIVEAGAPVSAEQSGVQSPDNRQVIITGSVTITTEDPIDAADDAIRITNAAGGRVDARTERAPLNGDQGGATLTLRLPSATLTASVDKLKALGDVEDISLSSLDVTSQSQDLDARITALDAAVQRLLVLLAESRDTDTLIALETAITDRQAELESLKSQRRYLSDQVSLSTIELVLLSEADAPVDEPVNFWTGLTTGWNSLVAAGSGLLIVVGVLLPWIVVAGAVTGLIFLVIRARRRRVRPTSPAVEPE